MRAPLCAACKTVPRLFPFCRPRSCAFDELVTIGRGEVEAVDFLEVADTLERLRAEGRLPLESVQNDSLQEIAEAHVVVFGERLEDFQDALLDADAGLGTFDYRVHAYHATTVLTVGLVSSLH